LEGLRKGAFLSVKDNSGAKKVKLLSVYGGKHLKGITSPGDLALVLVKKALPNKKVKHGEKLLGVVVQLKQFRRRIAGFVKSKRNLIVLLKKGDNLPFANRIGVSIALELRAKGFFRVFLISRGFFIKGKLFLKRNLFFSFDFFLSLNSFSNLEFGEDLCLIHYLRRLDFQLDWPKKVKIKSKYLDLIFTFLGQSN